MAFDKGNGGKFQPQPSVSTPFGTFYSTDVGVGEYQSLRIGSYGDKIALNFYKGIAGDRNKAASQYVSLDYEYACAILHYVIEPLIIQRVKDYQSGNEYKVGVWFEYNLTFTDKDTKQVRTIGTLSIKSEISATTQRNNVCICYNNGTDEWKIALGAGNIQNHLTMECPNVDGLDIGDSRFQQFAYIWKSIINCWIPIQLVNHQTGILMNNFNAIKAKLGIENKYQGKSGAKYSSDNYRSQAPDAPTPVSPEESEMSQNMPF